MKGRKGKKGREDASHDALHGSHAIGCAQGLSSLRAWVTYVKDFAEKVCRALGSIIPDVSQCP